MQTWVSNELETAHLGDQRLDRRFGLLLDRMSAKPSLKFPAACKGWAEIHAAYLFVKNDRVTPQKILAPHRQATIQRIKEQKVVILPQDTTEIDVTRKHEKMEGAGPLDDGSRIGFLAHPLLAVTPDKLVLGVVAAEIWTRPADTLSLRKTTTRSKRQAKPIEQKESFRWLEGYRQACQVAQEAPETQVICVSDSEGDIFECYAEELAQAAAGKRTADWIVRACRDRCLVPASRSTPEDPSSGDTEAAPALLWATVAARPVLRTISVQVRPHEAKSGNGQKRKKARSGRTAVLSVRAAGVTLRGPSRKGGRLPDLRINAVLVREEAPPEGEEPIEWFLLTNLPIDHVEDIISIIEYYCCRWQVEIYFKVLKSGCKVEDSQLEKAKRFTVYLALQMIVAWRVMYAMTLGRECPELPCDVVFEPEEWQAVYAVVKEEPPPATPPKLGEVVGLIASLGGYIGRKKDGPPGPKAVWVGMQRMMDLAQGWRARTEQTPRPRDQQKGEPAINSKRRTHTDYAPRQPTDRDVYND